MKHLFSRRSRLALAGLVVSVALAGCVEPESDVPVKPMSPALKQEALSFGIASETAKRCGWRLGLNTAQIQKLKPSLEAELLGPNGVRPSQRRIDAIVKASLSEKEVQDYVLGFVQKRDIVISDSRTWCAAGEQEIARKTAIGKYLTLRK